MKHSAKILSLFLCVSLMLSGCDAVSPADSSVGSHEDLLISEAEAVFEPPKEEIKEPEPVREVLPKVYLSANTVKRGNYFMIYICDTPAKSIEYTDFLGYTRTLCEYEGGLFDFVPVKVAASAGEYELSITIPTYNGEDYEYKATITVENRSFETQYLEVAAETLEQTLEDDYARNEFSQKTTPLKSTYTGEKLWNGNFIAPLGNAYYSITTSFGTFRTFSNGDTEYHNAVDMAAKGGTPVLATNSGKVIFAKFLMLTGNTVVIDHGLGVLSWHYHMKSISVSEGDFVAKGDRIGRVGTTGLSTGNHLHFGITINGIFTDPYRIIGTKPQTDFWRLNET